MRPCRRGGMAGTAAQTVLTKARQPPRAKLLIIVNGKSGKALRYKRPYESACSGSDMFRCERYARSVPGGLADYALLTK